MRILAVLNREGGTLRTTDLEAFSERARSTLEAAGHSVEFVFVEGSGIVEALAKAARKRGIDVVMAGGGDGTISAAAAALSGSSKALAVLPAGTMNLFARSLGLPLDLDDAVAAFADGKVRKVDVATANGRVFVHQFSIGMHAKLVAQRARMTYKSRLGKIRASAKAAVDTILKPPALNCTLDIDGTVRKVKSTGIGVSNNVFGEGHLPYADHPDGGKLGVYVASARHRGELVLFSLNMALGRWEANEHVDIHVGERVTLTVGKKRRRRGCVIDGELCDLDPVTVIETRPGALKVLAPSQEAAS